MNLFANCVLALDATTGERKWHFQTIHHDIFDYDNPPAPILATIRDGDESRDVAVQLTKMGLTFVLDRDTGVPVFPVEERTVPASKVPGEQAWPTQPFPLKPPPLVRLATYEADLTHITPESHASALEQFGQYETGFLYTPASLRGTITTPGHQGGVEWGGGAFDPETNVLYVNANEAPTINRLQPLETGQKAKPIISNNQTPKQTSTPQYAQIAPFFSDPYGVPAISPPWGTLNAIDLNKGEILWKVPLGEYPQLVAKGIRNTGAKNFGGPVLTAGGVLFIAATPDEKIRAFDKNSGKVLWEHKLPAGGYATPSVYMIEGRQYVAIAAGGGGKLGTKYGDAIIAFALPDSGTSNQ
ncbi:MAG: PQQ-binding-like beta-propeller repeat protein [Planctomycetes bacterium]|nr:PQQ-binding-like beta-propeller repeat protein [Planctomycetota bacterium]